MEHYTFNEQNLIAKRGEFFFEVVMRYQINRSHYLNYYDLRDDNDAQNRDIDFSIVARNNALITCEVKCDTKNTGNIFAEISVDSFRHDDSGNIISYYSKRGWLYQSRADWIFYYCEKLHTVYLFERVYFIRWLNRRLTSYVVTKERRSNPHYTEYKVRSAPNYGGMDGKDTNTEYFGLGICVPVRDMIKAEEMQGHFLLINIPQRYIEKYA